MAEVNLGRVAIIPKGQYSATMSYSRLDAVYYDGQTWLCLRNCNGVVPAEGTYWMVLVEKLTFSDLTDAQKTDLAQGATTAANEARNYAETVSNTLTSFAGSTDPGQAIAAQVSQNTADISGLIDRESSLAKVISVVEVDNVSETEKNVLLKNPNETTQYYPKTTSDNVVDAETGETIKTTVLGSYVNTDLSSSVNLLSGKTVDSRSQYGYALVNTQDTSLRYTDYIPVTAGTKIQVTIMNRLSPTNFEGWGTYNSNKVAVNTGDHYYGSGDGEYGKNVLRTITIPNGVSYIRVTFNNNGDTFKYIGNTWKDGLSQKVVSLGSSIQSLASTTTTLNSEVSTIKSDLYSTAKSVTATETERTVYSESPARYTHKISLSDTIDEDKVINKTDSFVEEILFYDLFNNLISWSGYVSSQTSFTIPRGCKYIVYVNRSTSVVSFTFNAKVKDDMNEVRMFFRTAVTSDGTVGKAYDAGAAVHRLPCAGGKTYVYANNAKQFRSTAGGTKTYLAQYSVNGTLLKVELMSFDAGYNLLTYKKNEEQYNLKGYIFTTEADTAYIYLNCSCNGASFLIDNTEFAYVLKEYNKINESDITNTPLSIWVLGDSITASRYNSSVVPQTYTGSFGGWISQFLRNVSVRPMKWYNGSAGGWTLSDNSSNGKSANSFIKELEMLITKYDNNEISAPDVLIVCGCTNDMDLNRYVTNAEISAAGFDDYDEYMEDAFFLHEVSGMDYYHWGLKPLENVNKGKIAGACRYIVERAGTVFKNCRFVFLTSPHCTRKKVSNQIKCHRDMKWACARMSVPVIDVWSECQMPTLWDYNSDWNADEPLNHRFLNDGVHTYDGNEIGNVGYIRQGIFIAREFSRLFGEILGQKADTQGKDYVTN